MVKRDLIGNILILIASLILAILLRVFVFSAHKISSDEANHYLKVGDYVILSKLSKPSYKDFVIYKIDDKEYLSRVVALPGDTASYLDDIFYLNHQVANESYLFEMREADIESYSVDKPFTEDFTLDKIAQQPLSNIPEKKYLVLNDNRRDKNDSRSFGLITDNQIEGVVTFKISPLEEFGFVDVE